MKSDFQRTGRLYRKIDIYLCGTYHSSTNHWRLCRDAKASVAERYGHQLKNLRAYFAPSFN